jgi:hypothetical protein
MLAPWSAGQTMTVTSGSASRSRGSRRKIELSGAAVDVLRRHKAKMIAFSIDQRRPIDPSGDVFSRVDGQALAVTTTWKLWGRLRKRPGSLTFASATLATRGAKWPPDRLHPTRSGCRLPPIGSHIASRYDL